MKTINFKFEMDQDVVTSFGDVGIVDMLGCDDGGVKYFVKTRAESNWFKEKDLKLAMPELTED